MNTVQFLKGVAALSNFSFFLTMPPFLTKNLSLNIFQPVLLSPGESLQPLLPQSPPCICCHKPTLISSCLKFYVHY